MALLVITNTNPERFAEPLKEMAPDLDVRTWPAAGNLDEVEFVLAWKPPPGVLKTLPKLDVIFSVGAGVDHLLLDPELPDRPIVRFVDRNLTQRMTEYVALHTLFHHRRMSEYLGFQSRRRWVELSEPEAGDVRVGVMGLGVLGAASAERLLALGYRVASWSRTAKSAPGVTSFAGAEGLEPFLRQTDILVTLLPLTSETRGIIDRRLLGMLARDGRLPGPVLINAGRGGLQVEKDILAALESGALYSASLDVFETEPLPESSPLWRHPRVVITPHNAAVSDELAVARYVVEQLAGYRKTGKLENLVEVRRGY
ncbi:MAG: glyoxylate/hydroxypyruvate reductase A [Hyphomicrobiaceae bacterium]|nr:glyoxylate/hydroxypyruvate reductase A [Hyphomicrobiaceae bacterium]